MKLRTLAIRWMKEHLLIIRIQSQVSRLTRNARKFYKGGKNLLHSIQREEINKQI